MAAGKIPLATVRRLCIYKRFLEKLRFVGKEKTSSLEIGGYTGIPPYQVRKDISHLGEVGIVGRGYSIDGLVEHIVSHLGLDGSRQCIVVGIGALGTAVVRFFAGSRRQYEVVAGFDQDRGKIGTSVAGVEILPVSRLPATVKRKRVELGIVTVPASAAQGVADLMVSAGIRGVLNFAPVILNVPASVVKRDMDFIFEMETLSYLVGA